MFAGHVGAALAIGRADPQVNVGVFVTAAFLLDLLLWLLVLLGWESVSIPADFASTRQPAFDFPYSHGLASTPWWMRRGGRFIVAPRGTIEPMAPGVAGGRSRVLALAPRRSRPSPRVAGGRCRFRQGRPGAVGPHACGAGDRGRNRRRWAVALHDRQSIVAPTIDRSCGARPRDRGVHGAGHDDGATAAVCARNGRELARHRHRGLRSGVVAWTARGCAAQRGLIIKRSVPAGSSAAICRKAGCLAKSALGRIKLPEDGIRPPAGTRQRQLKSDPARPSPDAARIRVKAVEQQGDPR